MAEAATKAPVRAPEPRRAARPTPRPAFGTPRTEPSPGNGRIARAQKPAGPASGEPPTRRARAGTAAKTATPARGKRAAPSKEGAKPGKKRTGKAGTGAAAASTASKRSEAGDVKLLMPPPPTTLSAAAAQRIARTTKVVTEHALAEKTLPDADVQVSKARKGADEPKDAVQAEANQDHIAHEEKLEPPDPRITSLCEQIYQKVESGSVEDLVAYAHKELAKTVDAQTTTVTNTYTGIEKQPKPKREPRKGQPIVPEKPVKPAHSGAEKAVPDAIPDHALSTRDDLAATDKKIDDAGLNKPTARLVNTGVIADVRRERGDLQKLSETDAAKLKAQQQEILRRRAAEQKRLDDAASTKLATERRGAIVGDFKNQVSLASSEKAMMTLFTKAANSIVVDTAKTVDAKLTRLQGKVDELWKQKTAPAGKIRKYVKTVGDVIEKRYSGFTGGLRSAGESIAGFFGADTEKERLARELHAAKVDYARIVCEAATDVSRYINTEIKACKKLIADAKTAVDGLIGALPESLRAQAEAQKDSFTKRLDDLDRKVDLTRNKMTAQLMVNAVESVHEIEQLVNKLRNKMKSVLDKIADFVSDFLDDPVRAIINGLLDLVGIPRSSFWRLVDRFRAVLSDIADDPRRFANNLMKALKKGFGQFFDNIKTHLLHGFLNWLFGKLGDVNVTVPKDMSLRSIVTLFLEVMGISWERIRKLLVKHVGEKNVALVEKAVSLIKLLIKKGPGGILDMIKEKLDPKAIFDTVLHAAVDFVVETLIKKIAARILMMLNPVGAIVQAVEAIYRVVKWVIDNAARIFKLVETIVNGAVDIMKGNIGGMANAIEKVLAGLIPPVIDFFAGWLGLGDLPQKIADIIKKLQGRVERILDQVIGFFVSKAKGLLGAVKGAVAALFKRTHRMKAQDGEEHSITAEAGAGKPHVTVASKPVGLQAQIQERRRKSKQKNNPIPLTARQEAALTQAWDRYAELVKTLSGYEKKSDAERKSVDAQVQKHLAYIATRLVTADVWIAKKPVRPTHVTFAPVDGIGGTVTANPLTQRPGNTHGSPPDRSTLLYMPGRQSRRGVRQSGIQWVRVHLLADRLHGPGIAKNLVPGDGKTTNAEFRKPEKAAFDAITAGWELKYVARVNQMVPDAKGNPYPAKGSGTIEVTIEVLSPTDETIQKDWRIPAKGLPTTNTTDDYETIVDAFGSQGGNEPSGLRQLSDWTNGVVSKSKIGVMLAEMVGWDPGKVARYEASSLLAWYQKRRKA